MNQIFFSCFFSLQNLLSSDTGHGGFTFEDALCSYADIVEGSSLALDWSQIFLFHARHKSTDRFILIRGGTEAYSVFFIVFRQVTQCLALSGQNSLPTQQICLKFNQPHSYLFWPSQIRLKEEGELSETTVVLWQKLYFYLIKSVFRRRNFTFGQ